LTRGISTETEDIDEGEEEESLSQNYFGTILRYYFLAGAEIVPRNSLCDRKKKSA
jgi:hypothetical protein